MPILAPNRNTRAAELQPDMQRRLTRLIAWVFFLASVSNTLFAAEHADRILRSGVVYTADSKRTVAEAVALRGNRIIAVGANSEIDALRGPGTEVHDLGGRLVLPGLHDTHVHALGTVEPDMCDLASATLTLDELVQFLKPCLAKYAPEPGQWLIVLQWNYAVGNQPSARYPTLRSALDAVSKVNPVLLAGNDGHHGAANSAALAEARDPNGVAVGLSRETLTTVFSNWKEHVAVDATGEPSGGINEGARLLVRPGLFEDFLGGNESPEVLMPKVAAVMASRGITSIQDPALQPAALAAYQWLEQSGGMTFRMRAGFYERPVDSLSAEATDQIPSLIEKFREARESCSNCKLIRADGVKLFADGVLEGNPLTDPPTLPVAAVLNGYRQPIFRADIAEGEITLEGYVDPDSAACTRVKAHPEKFSTPVEVAAFREANGYLPVRCLPAAGVLENSEAFIKAFVQQATDAGFNVHIHALADKGVRIAVDALEAAKASADRQGLTQSLAHLQLVHPDDQRRIGRLGIYNAFTYAWIVGDSAYNTTVIPFLEQVESLDAMFNPDTYYMQNVYPVKAIADAGGVLTWGSDAPVESRDPRPFLNLEQAVTRASDGQVLNASQIIDIHTALAAFTINGARMLGIGNETGSIEPGKLADLIVLDRNVVQLAEGGKADGISETQVDLTLFDGRIVYQRVVDGAAR